MSISRWLAVAVVIALLAIAGLAIGAYSRTSASEASVSHVSSLPPGSVTSPDDAQAQKWQAVDDRLRALYPQAFAEAAASERWKEVEERYRVLYPDAFTRASMEQSYCTLKERIYATCVLPTDTH